MKKLKSKYVVILLDCAGPQKEKWEYSGIPAVKTKFDEMWEKDRKSLGFPAVFMLNAPADQVHYTMIASWADSSKRMREIRKALSKVDITKGETDGSDDQADEPEAPQAVKMETWTNTDGKTIQAILLRMEGEKVIFKMKSGKEVSYPLEKLSEASQEKVKEVLAGDKEED